MFYLIFICMSFGVKPSQFIRGEIKQYKGVDSRYQTLGVFQGLSFAHPLWPSERKEKEIRESWAPSGIPRRLALTCAAEKTKGIRLISQQREGNQRHSFCRLRFPRGREHLR
jgi:hypothetical protein